MTETVPPQPDLPDLRRQLSEIPPEEQDAVLAESGRGVPAAELIDLVVSPPEPAGAFVPRRLESLLVVRGPAVVDEIAAAMRDRPLARSTRRLASVLADIRDRHPLEADRVAETLVEVMERALDQGAGTWEVAELLGRYLENGDVTRTRPAALRIAHRVLAAGATEPEPYRLALEQAHALIGTGS